MRADAPRGRCRGTERRQRRVSSRAATDQIAFGPWPENVRRDRSPNNGRSTPLVDCQQVLNNRATLDGEIRHRTHHIGPFRAAVSFARDEHCIETARRRLCSCCISKELTHNRGVADHRPQPVAWIVHRSRRRIKRPVHQGRCAVSPNLCITVHCMHRVAPRAERTTLSGPTPARQRKIELT